MLAWITRRQGYLFFPLLLLEGINLHLASIRSLFSRRGPVKGRWFELSMIGLRFAIYFGARVLAAAVRHGRSPSSASSSRSSACTWVPSFAPNHKGMPIVPAEVKLDFFSKQVRTSRNICGGWWANVLMGGLNYQIEHHLFPSMARPNLRKARALVKRALPRPRRALHRDQADPLVRIVIGLPQPGRAGRPRPVRLPAGRADGPRLRV